MRTSTASAFLLVTLALVACGPDTATGPLPSSAPSVSPVGAGTTASQSATELPFRGTLDARETGQFQPATNTVRLHLVGTGTATHLGRYTLVADFTLTPATGTAAGSMTLTAANGDVLTATFTGQGVPTGGISAIVETATITGGTGRF